MSVSRFFILVTGMMIHLSAYASDSFKEPEILEGNKSHTLNGTGYVFFTLSSITKAFLRQECIAGNRVLDVGTGFSNIPIEALEPIFTV